MPDRRDEKAMPPIKRALAGRGGWDCVGGFLLLRATLLQQVSFLDRAFRCDSVMISLLSRLLSRKTALHLLAVLLLLAQTLGAMHRVAHAGIATPQQISAAAAQGNGWNDLFGHDAGAGCDDWNAAFSADANPDTGVPDLAIIAADSSAPVSYFQQYFVNAPEGLSLARAPPRV